MRAAWALPDGGMDRRLNLPELLHLQSRGTEASAHRTDREMARKQHSQRSCHQ